MKFIVITIIFLLFWTTLAAGAYAGFTYLCFRLGDDSEALSYAKIGVVWAVAVIGVISASLYIWLTWSNLLNIAHSAIVFIWRHRKLATFIEYCIAIWLCVKIFQRMSSNKKTMKLVLGLSAAHVAGNYGIWYRPFIGIDQEGDFMIALSLYCVLAFMFMYAWVYLMTKMD